MKKEAKNCWEFEKCPKDVRDKCPAYKYNSGRECWFIAGSSSQKDRYCPKLRNKIKNCWDCEWYKKLNPNDK
ncbi:hypothetical protein GOV12_05790 [Candidatus Pacearchaeota archaeon]|nr:hypothetical protein [Candidatus Pacearchaeota archaeon]